MQIDSQYVEDCEVCCRPMVIAFDTDPGTDFVAATARGLDD